MNDGGVATAAARNSTVPGNARIIHPSHAVQFYDSDAFLTQVVGRFIGSGIAAGDSVVAIVTDVHRQAFLRRLRTNHFDTDAALSAGRLIFLDAQATLARLMVDGLPAADRFATVVGGALRGAASGHAHVRAFAGMVDILWRQGNPAAAVRLEELWNDLGRHQDFSLLCAYVMENFYSEDSARAVRDVLDAHGLVLPPEGGSHSHASEDPLADILQLQQARVLEAELERRRRAEAGLAHLLVEQTRRSEQTEERFRLLVASVSDYAIFMLDPRGVITSWNIGAQRIKGYEASEIVGQHFSRFYPEADVRAGKCERELEIAAREGKFEEEGWRVRKDGSRFWANVVISRMLAPNGELMGFAKVTRDLTERRRLQIEQVTRAAAEAEQARLNDLFMRLPIPIMLSRGPDDVIQLVNPAYCELVDRRAADLVGTTTRAAFSEQLPDWTHLDVRASVYRSGTRFAADEYPMTLVRRGRLEKVILRIAIEPMRDAEGRVCGLLSVAVDTTQQVEARRTLEWALEEQKRTDELREQLMGVVGHDLRTPLQSIIISADTLLRRANLPEAETKGVARIARAAGRMGRMISQLLDFTRCRLGGGMPIQPDRADLAKICAEVITEHETTFPDRTFVFDDDGDMVGQWDYDRLSQVVANLTGNAVQHGDAKSPVELRLSDEGEHVSLRVHNRGAPIPADAQSVIFEPFRRAARERREKTDSLGLGLFIAREIVRAHGGEIEVTSTEESGTTFTVRLPRTPPAPAADSRPA